MDATFKIVPKGCFKQFLVIYIEYFEEVRVKYNTKILFLKNIIYFLDFSHVFYSYG